MKFFKVLPKEKQNLKNACKTCNSLQDFRPATSLKNRLQSGCFFCEYSKHFSKNIFYGTIPVAAFELF